MEKEIVPINAQIVLFFDKIIEDNTIKLANSICDKMPEIGQPNIFNIPNNVPNEIRMQAPKIIYNNTNHVNITVTSAKMDIILNNGMNINVEKIYQALSENGLNVKAVGIVNTYISNNIKIEKIQNYFNDKEIIKSSLINFSWYIKEENINIWKNIETELNNGITNLRYTIDINNLGNNTILTMQEITAILQKSNSITKQAIEKISKELGE